MPLNIQPSTSTERKLLVLETIINSTDLVSKVSDHSGLGAIAGGISKIAGKAEKDIILAVAQLFPDSAYGAELDQVALDRGVAPRFAASGSSVYIRLIAAPGTNYLVSTHFFTSSTGIRFALENDVTMPAVGYTYAKILSLDQGAKTNVDPNSIAKISPAPAGHIAAVNDVAAYGGMDVETDELFRRRIKDGPNILARGTIAMLEQVFMKINPKVLRVFYQGSDWNGKLNLAVVTQNGSNLTQTELDALTFQGSNYFTLSEYRPYGTEFYGVKLQNMLYQPIDVSFRVELDASFNPDDVRKAIQIGMLKYMDFRFFDPATQRVEWDNLLDIVKNTKGVKYCPDQYFYPQEDIAVYTHKLPRLRGFVMMDMQGVVIANFSGTLLPVYYPNNPDFSYAQTVLQNIT